MKTWRDVRNTPPLEAPPKSASAPPPRTARWVILVVALVPLALATLVDIASALDHLTSGYRSATLVTAVCVAVSAGILLVAAIAQKWRPVLRGVLGGFLVLMIAAFVIVKAEWKLPPDSYGATEADQAIASQVADYLLKSGNTAHVKQVKVVDGSIFVNTDLDGSMPTALESATAIDLCKAASAGAPKNSAVSVWNASKLPLFGC